MFVAIAVVICVAALIGFAAWTALRNMVKW
jgi:hypothetical protein